MKRTLVSRWMVPTLTLLVSGLATPALWSDTRPARAPETKPATLPARFDLEFDPPATDVPAKRVAGLSRGGNVLTYVCVLAPIASVGLTTREQPVLYWYLDYRPDLKPELRQKVRDLGVVTAPVEIDLIPLGEDGRTTTGNSVLELTLEGPKRVGLQKLDLSRVKGPDGGPVRLREGVQYKWAITVDEDHVRPSENAVAQCRLKRVAIPADLASAVKGADAAELARACGKAGIWFDQMAALNELIERFPEERRLVDARRRLLKDQNLVEDEHGRLAERQPPGGTKGD